MKKILLIDGSLHGHGGNTHALTTQLTALFGEGYAIDRLELKQCPDVTDHEQRFQEAEGFIFATGTYWQSWSSYAQRFFEQATEWEATDLFLGKPVCCVVTMHSLGGMGVLSRLQSNFSLFGCVIPPMCAIVHSYVNQLATASNREANAYHDIWDARYLPTVAHNFKAALLRTHDYQSWDVDREEVTHQLWLK